MPHSLDSVMFARRMSFKALNHTFFLSRADGTFEDVSSQCGLVEGGKGLGVISADLNEDGHLDLYVANDTTANFLFKGDGTGGFEEIGLIAGVAVDGSGAPNGSMGICLFNSTVICVRIYGLPTMKTKRSPRIRTREI